MAKPLSKVVAIDLDGVIHNYKNPPLPGKVMSEPFADAEEKIDDLIQRGFKIVIHTVKATTPEGKQAVIDWLDYYTIDYHEVTAVKPNALYYVDDRAIRHTSWSDTMNQINALEGYKDED